MYICDEVHHYTWNMFCANRALVSYVEG
jgi:hypothetical protein